MPEAALIPLLIATTVVGAGVSAYGAIQQNKAQQEIVAQQKQQESLRQSAMQLDARRRTRQAVRQAQQARAQALAASIGQGAGTGGSGLAGGYGQISGQEGLTLQGINESSYLGAQNFGINQTITGLKGDLSEAGMYGQLGGSLTSLGRGLVSDLGSLNRISQIPAGRQS